MTPEEQEKIRQAEEAEMDDKRMTLIEHLDELRLRLRNAGIAVILSLLPAFYFVEKEFALLVRPVLDGLKAAGHSPELVATDVSEGFWVYFRLAMIISIAVASPLVFWELWKFVAPGLYKKEKRIAGVVTGATVLCFLGGGLFGYLLLTKPAVQYLAGIYNPKGEVVIKAMIKMNDAAGFVSMMLLGCGLAFELPVVVAVMGWLGIVSAKGLWKFNKYALILSALLGGILTPGADVASQVLLAGPIFVLYNLSIVVVLLIERANKKRLVDQQSEIDRQYETGTSSNA